MSKNLDFAPNPQGPEPNIGPNLTSYNSDAFIFIWNVVYSTQNNIVGCFLDDDK